MNHETLPQGDASDVVPGRRPDPAPTPAISITVPIPNSQARPPLDQDEE